VLAASVVGLRGGVAREADAITPAAARDPVEAFFRSLDTLETA
jgi:hypothetical protein